MKLAFIYSSMISNALLSNYKRSYLLLLSSKQVIVCSAAKSSFNRLNGMRHAFPFGWMWVLHAPAHHSLVWTRRLLLLCCSHHCTQHRVCTACWYFSGHRLFCASSAVRQIQCTNKALRSGWHGSQEEKHFQCVLLATKASHWDIPKLDTLYD